jgi:hypothetical protein
MALPVGQISLSEVNTELGISPASTLITMNDAAVRTLAGVGGSGTVISMSNLQGKSNVLSLVISTDTTNYNVRSAAISAGWPGSVDQSVEVTINPGVTISSTSTGSAAFSTGTPWPAGSSISIVNNGTIVGRGGNGGNGGNSGPSLSASPGSSGNAGGPALNVQKSITFSNLGSVLGGGGGGGGGAGSWSLPTKNFRSLGGGGGGGGAGVSTGGTGGVANPAPSGAGIPGSPGGSGTLSTAGSGGSGGSAPTALPAAGPGGSGGAVGSSGATGTPRPAASGGSGGASGAAITGNPLITYSGPPGTISGPVS